MASIVNRCVFQDFTGMLLNQQDESKLASSVDFLREKCAKQSIPSNSLQAIESLVTPSGKKKKAERKVTFGATQLGFFNKNGVVSDQRVASLVSTKVDLQNAIRKNQLDEIYATIHDLERGLSLLSGQQWKNSLIQINRLTELAEVLEASFHTEEEMYVFDSDEFEESDEECGGFSMSHDEMWENTHAMEAILSGQDDDFI